MPAQGNVEIYFLNKRILQLSTELLQMSHYFNLRIVDYTMYRPTLNYEILAVELMITLIY